MPMHNMTAKKVGDKLVIEIDVSEQAKRQALPPKEGKTNYLLSSSGGFTSIEGFRVSLNVLR